MAASAVPRVAFERLVAWLRPGAGGTILALVLLANGQPAAAAPVTATFAPAADARVVAARPANNYGGSSVLMTDAGGGSAAESLLRFDVQGVSGAVQKARLRLFATSATLAGPGVQATTGDWTELGVTWQNRPAPAGAITADFGAIAKNTWVELDVTPIVQGDGSWNLLLAQTGTDSVHFKSRESSSRAPELVVVFDAGGTPPPPPSPGVAGPLSQTFVPLADTRVVEGAPDSNYGTSTRLMTDGGTGDRAESLLRFSVQGLTGKVVQATLRLNSTSSTVDGPAVHLTTSAWTEYGVTWANRPPTMGPPVADKGAMGTGWYTFDVTALVTGNGTLDLKLAQPGTDSVHFTSREHASKPELVVVYQAEPCPGGCDDGNVCTQDSCDDTGDPATTGCAHETVVGPCDDGNACTTADACQDAFCSSGAALVCDDGNPCTDDGCDPVQGCKSTANTAPCSDGDACTGSDACAGGACTAGAKLSCDDGNLCTTDACDAATGCSHTGNALPCNDGNACTSADACTGASCVAGAAVACTDGNLCTTDGCDATTGCTFVANTLPCDADGSACTLNDVCQGGACTAGPAKACEDGAFCTLDSCEPATGLCKTAPNPAAACVRTFQRNYGGTGDDKGHGIAAMADGGFVLVGKTASFGVIDLAVTPTPTDVYVVRVDSCGAKVWERSLGGSKDEIAYDVIATADGGTLLVGESKSWAGMYVVKLTSSGTTSFARSFGKGGYDVAHTAVQLADGGYVLLGETYIPKPDGTSKHDVMLMKLDQAGVLQWTEMYGGTVDGDAGEAMLVTRDGGGQEDGLLVAGGVESYSYGKDDVWLFKTDLAGQMLWSVGYGQTADDEAIGLAATPDGGYVVTGFTRGFNASLKDVLLLKVDGAGNHQWTWRYGGAMEEEGRSVVPLADGYLVGGWTASYGFGSDDFLLLRTDLAGKLLYFRTLGGKYADTAWQMEPTADAGYLLFGSSYTFRTGSLSGTRDLYLAKARLDGSAGCNVMAIDPLTVSTAKLAPWRKDFVPLHESGGGLKWSTSTQNLGPAGTAKTLCTCQ